MFFSFSSDKIDLMQISILNIKKKFFIQEILCSWTVLEIWDANHEFILVKAVHGEVVFALDFTLVLYVVDVQGLVLFIKHK